MPKPRLVQVLLTPVFVVEDDDGNLAPLGQIEALPVNAADWPTFYETRWAGIVEQVVAQLDAQQNADD